MGTKPAAGVIKTKPQIAPQHHPKILTWFVCIPAQDNPAAQADIWLFNIAFEANFSEVKTEPSLKSNHLIHKIAVSTRMSEILADFCL